MSATNFLIQMNNSIKSYRNGFKDGAVVGPLKLQWGQEVCTSDDLQYFNFHSAFASACYAVITTSSMPNARSGLPVVKREKTRFGVDRDGAINGPYPFYYIAVGDATSTTNSGYSVLNGRAGAVDASACLFWGNATSTSDGDQTFTTPRALSSGASAIVTTVTHSSVRSVLPATSFNGPGRSLMINRHNDVNGSVGFNYLGIGGAPQAGYNTDKTAALRVGDLKLQWGRANSTSDYEEMFLLPESFADMNFAVVTTLRVSGLRSGLALTRPLNPRSFVVDRAGSEIDGSREFFWLAIGR